MTNLFVLLADGVIAKFPYTQEQFRAHHSNTSFPRPIPVEILKRYGVFPVGELAKPDFDPLVQGLKRDDEPHKEVIRLKTEQDATDPFTGEVDQEQVGQPIYGNRWLIGYTVEYKPQDQAENNVRAHRDRLLADTDWIVAVSYERGEPVPQAWAEYRQNLRDVPDQPRFPYSVEWPTKPE